MKKKIVIPIIILLLLTIGGLGYKIYLDYNELKEKTENIEKLEGQVKEKEEAIKELDENIKELKAGEGPTLATDIRGVFFLKNEEDSRGPGPMSITLAVLNAEGSLCYMTISDGFGIEGNPGYCRITNNSVVFEPDNNELNPLTFRITNNNRLELASNPSLQRLTGTLERVASFFE